MVGEKRKNEACAVDGRARAARRTSCLSRLSGVSRVCRHQGSSALIFIIIIESGEGVVVRDAGHLPARKSSRVETNSTSYVRGVIRFLVLSRSKRAGCAAWTARAYE